MKLWIQRNASEIKSRVNIILRLVSSVRSSLVPFWETADKDPPATEATTSASTTPNTSQETPLWPQQVRKPPNYVKDYLLY